MNSNHEAGAAIRLDYDEVEELAACQRPLPAHFMAHLVPVDTSQSFDEMEAQTLHDWGYDSAEAAYGPGPHPWRDNLRRAWDEVRAETIDGITTPLRCSMFQHQVKPNPAASGDDERNGLLGRQIAKAEFLRAHPEVLENTECIDSPIVLIGQNRTGTTLLHRLLALDDRHARTAKAWELMSPVPPPQRETYDTDPRQARAQRITQKFQELFPQLTYFHDLDFTKPEECLFAMNADMPDFASLINTPGPHTHRVLGDNAEEMDAVYASYRRTLQILSYRYPPPYHWILKCPSHLPHLKIFLQYFPKARFVWTHRSMDDVIASFCRLSCVFATMPLPVLTPATMGNHMFQYYDKLIHQGMAARDAVGDKDDRFLDVRYDDLVADPIGQVRMIYDHLGLDFSKDYQTKLEKYLQDDAVERQRLLEERQAECDAANEDAWSNRLFFSRSARLEDYGLKPDQVAKTFATYHERFLKVPG